MKTKNLNKATISNSTVGAATVGDHSHTVGAVTVNHGSLTQAEYLEHIKTAQKALVDDEENLEPLLYEAFHQLLRLAREIQVDQRSLADIQAKMKETLDEVWAQQAAKGMKSEILPKGLEVVAALAKNPATAELAKKLLET